MYPLNALAIGLMTLAASSYAAPAPSPSALPDGFEPITREEILKRLDTTPSETGPLEKRTPGNVRSPTPCRYQQPRSLQGG